MSKKKQFFSEYARDVGKYIESPQKGLKCAWCVTKIPELNESSRELWMIRRIMRASNGLKASQFLRVLREF